MPQSARTGDAFVVIDVPPFKDAVLASQTFDRQGPPARALPTSFACAWWFFENRFPLFGIMLV
jgi:hypothetical protein